ncbi:MAG: hypothetical protein ACRDEB_04845, partial [Chitinophagaceae bacterium]
FHMMTVEENRKKVRKNNLLVSLLFLIMIAGIGGAIYYYRNLKIAKVSLQKEKNEVEILKDRLQHQNEKFQIVFDEAERLKFMLDSIARIRPFSNEFQVFRNDLDKILKPVTVSRDSARSHARVGYDKLIRKDLKGAMEEFGKSDNFYNGYHESQKIHILLKENKDKLDDTAVQRRLLLKIRNDYNSLQKLNTQNIK